mmetsp:Transcript_70440/g.177579  ORF Transcript_70440/g.177579 Transcript_70440/m.177579 type:complete len:212 (+) Transcript_70440:27-662(+)
MHICSAMWLEGGPFGGTRPTMLLEACPFGSVESQIETMPLLGSVRPGGGGGSTSSPLSPAGFSAAARSDAAFSRSISWRRGCRCTRLRRARCVLSTSPVPLLKKPPKSSEQRRIRARCTLLGLVKRLSCGMWQYSQSCPARHPVGSCNDAHGRQVPEECSCEPADQNSPRSNCNSRLLSTMRVTSNGLHAGVKSAKRSSKLADVGSMPPPL